MDGKKGRKERKGGGENVRNYLLDYGDWIGKFKICKSGRQTLNSRALAEAVAHRQNFFFLRENSVCY